jgi:hypothetical protein
MLSSSSRRVSIPSLRSLLDHREGSLFRGLGASWRACVV